MPERDFRSRQLTVSQGRLTFSKQLFSIGVRFRGEGSECGNSAPREHHAGKENR
jgi:hypothetical protein